MRGPDATMTEARASRWNRPEPPPDADPYTRRRRLKLAASIALFFSSLLAVAGLVALEMHRELLACGATADAVVFTMQPATIADSPRSMIRFRTTEGALVETHHPSSLSFDQPPVGTRLRVAYDPADPKRVGYVGWSAELKQLAVFLGFSVFWGWIGARSYRRMKAIPRPPPNVGRRRSSRKPAGASPDLAPPAAPPASPDP